MIGFASSATESDMEVYRVQYAHGIHGSYGKLLENDSYCKDSNIINALCWFFLELSVGEYSLKIMLTS
jgi:hypothetical protein